MGSFNCIFQNNSRKALFGQNIKKVTILKLSPDSRYLQELPLKMNYELKQQEFKMLQEQQALEREKIEAMAKQQLQTQQ